ncbi:sulfite exporter TauE/SafE family protein [Pseudalkalibacillus sp. SCS-8]|uniref:urease accessory protein UreH domain-containing protein n=1 Tax=Pseudalkalibacillus nanhaiensis TaxID=3115291 RepID=UPI0032DB27AE
MYELFTNITRLFYDPLINAVYNTEGIPILSALFLGILGSVAPCQLTGNIGAITIYGNRSLQKEVSWSQLFSFILGKIMVFSTLGLVVLLVGSGIEQSMTGILPWVRKMVGPLFIFIGLFMVGIIPLRWSLAFNHSRIKTDGKSGSFLMGVLFSLGFCPTMFLLFFGMFMPIVLSTSYGMALPPVFAIGTSIPVVLILFLMWYFEINRNLLKKSRRIGSIIQKTAGVFIILIGILDTITYWTI